MQPTRRTAASNPVRNFIVPRPSRIRICVSGGDAQLASVVTKVLSRQAGSLKTNSNPVLRPRCTQDRFNPKVEQVNELLRAKPLISVATAGFNPGQLQGGTCGEGKHGGGKHMAEETDVIVVGAGLSGLVAATEIADAGKRVIVVDQEGEQSLGGQAFWSFGGLFLVDSPEQRRLGIKDSYDLALQDWLGTAGFDRDEDLWPRRWAEAYVAFAAGEKRDWLRAMGHRIFPVVGWAERGGYDAMGHGNSVPRFHVTWGTGPGIVEPFERRAREAQKNGL